MADKIVVLRAGNIEQVGSPLELYKTPRNTFVAGFIGSPRMNLIEGDIARRHDARTIGVRPEHLQVVDSGGTFTGQVGVAEHLGSDTFFHVHLDEMDEPMTVRAGGEVGLSHGDTIHLSPQPDKIHRFDDRGLRIP